MLEWKRFKEVYAFRSAKLRDPQLDWDVSIFFPIKIQISTLEFLVYEPRVSCLLLTKIEFHATRLVGSVAGGEYWFVRSEQCLEHVICDLAVLKK